MRGIKTKLLLGTGLLLSTLSLQAQNIAVTTDNTFCTGGGTSYVLNGNPGCTTFVWTVENPSGVNYVKETHYNWSVNNLGNFNISWLQPMTGIRIKCTYSNCSGTGGTAYTSTFNVSTAPTAYNVSASTTSFCDGDYGADITLTGSQTGVVYQLELNTLIVPGSSQNGTGGSLVWSNRTEGGTYKVRTVACSKLMNNTVYVTKNPKPAEFSVSGTGAYCPGGAGLTVSLSGSQDNVTYQLIVNNGTPFGDKTQTGGASISWPNQTSIGEYKIKASDATGCTRTMTTTATISQHTLPATNFTVAGGSASCLSAITVTMSGSQSGVNYQLQVNGSNAPISPVPGTGSGLTFTSQTTEGTYTVVATNTTTNCSVTLPSSTTLYTLPIQYTVTGGGAVCPGGGGSGLSITLNGSQPNVNYQLQEATLGNIGASVSRNDGQPIVWNNITALGTYTVYATKTSPSGCGRGMLGTASITSTGPTLPAEFGVSGGGGCGAPITVTMASSQPTSPHEIRYQLLITNNGSTSNAPVSEIVGDGTAKSWTGQTLPGTYTVRARDLQTGCTRIMPGSAVLNPNPTQFTVAGNATYCAGATGTTVTLTNSQTAVNYELTVGAQAVGTLPGSGTAVNFTNVTATGAITIIARSTANCTSTMLGNYTVSTITLPTFTANPPAASVWSDGSASYTPSLNPGNSTYTWTASATGNAALPSVTSGTTPISSSVVNPGPGDGTVVYSITPKANGCDGVPRNFVVNVSPHPKITFTGVVDGRISVNGATLDGGAGYATYQWTRNGSPVSTAQTISTIEPATYSLSVTRAGFSGNGTVSSVLVEQFSGYNQNYIVTNIPQIPTTVESAIKTYNLNQRSQTVQYFDGLGRPLQVISTQASPSKLDVVQPITYDEFGRETVKYLPFTGDISGLYKKNSDIIDAATKDYKGIASNFYNNAALKIADDGNKPFAITVLEPSPLGRVLKIGAPGPDWQPDLDPTYASNDHTIKKGYETNTLNDGVIQWIYSIASDGALGLIEKNVNPYPAASLIKNRTKDEHQREMFEYLDKQGRVILKRVQVTETPSTINDTNYASTYYIYDDLGQLVCVLQPEGTKRLDAEYFGKTNTEKQEFLQRWAFRYRYDNRNRMVIKQVPGADSVRMVYDQRDRLVYTQDGNQRLSNKWSFTKYDLLNRPIIAGEYTHGSPKTQAEMTGILTETQVFGETFSSTATTTHGYTSNTLANFSGTFDIYTVTYYDDHMFTSLVTAPEFKPGDVNYLHTHLTGQYVVNSNESFNHVRGQVTGMKTRILGSSNYLWSVNYYDDRYRIVQNVSSNHKGGVDRTTSVYDFVGKVMKTRMSHRVGSVTHDIEREFDYDHAGRLVKTWHKVDLRPKVILSALEYNELGQLVTKKLHASADNSIDEEGTVYSPDVIERSQYNNEVNIIGQTRVVLKPGFTVPGGKRFKASTENQWTTGNSNPLSSAYAQVVDYRYNIRGWMTKINDVDAPGQDLFTMTLNYNTSTLGSAYDQFNGNISEAIWTSAGLDKQSYGYKYDAMNRLTHGNYFNLVEANKSNRYNEIISNGSASGYDLNGNIKNLQRTGKRADANYSSMDDLTYSYTGNQVTRIDDLIGKLTTEEGFKENVKVDDEYVYDLNGNMTKDLNKGVNGIKYNMLNLPRVVKKSGADSIMYVYDATGRKLRQRTFGALNKTSDYAGEFFYENDTLKFVNHEEGRTVMTSAIPAYEYFMKDHLGNVRVSFKAITETTELKTNFEEASNNSFLNYPPDNTAFKPAMNDFDHSDAGTLYTRSQRLTGASGSQVGIAKSYEVMAGDVFDIEVFGKFEAKSSTPINLAGLGAAIASALIPSPTGTGLESNAAKTGISNAYSSAIVGRSEPDNSAAPKAYLNYILFNENFTTILDFGFDQIDASAGGLSAPHDQMSLHVSVQKKGYLYIFISNENNDYLQNVYFDDFKIRRSTYVESVNDYYPFGLAFNSYARENAVHQNNLYQGKELQEELDLNLYDFHARQYDAAIGRTTTMDPMADMFYSMSSYSWAANNPMRFVDPTGMVIEDGSRKEWDKQKGRVERRAEKLQGKIDKLNAKAEAKGWSADKLASKVGNLGERVASLKGSLSNMNTLENSVQVYSLKSGVQGEGGVSYDTKTGNVVIAYGNTANFVHETTHAGQFESGDMAFSADGSTLGQDVMDEVSAYKAQFAYDPSSVSGLTSSSVANSFGSITASWVQNIQASDGSKIYAPGGAANTGQVPIDINSGKAQLIKAYPKAAGAMRGLPSNYALRNTPGIRIAPYTPYRDNGCY